MCLSRRSLIKLAGLTAAGVGCAESSGGVSLFDGKTLDGWIQVENSAISFSSGGIADPAAFAAKLTSGADAVSAFLRGQLQASTRADLAGYSASNANAK